MSTLVGKVITGVSQGCWISYPVASGTVTSIGRIASMSASCDASDTVKWYADNKLAETAAGTVNNGTLTLSLDGLSTSNIQSLLGHVTTDDWTSFNTADTSPEVAWGCVVRFENSLGTYYSPVIFPICKFKEISLEGQTQEDAISFQPAQIEATFKKNSSKIWKYSGGNYTTEAEALSAMEAKMRTLVK